ncbi:glycosyltransferase family 4 protein [Sediminibacter sp. Hel_I_10]|uniref:glycosyltransferase family 4 protein n=1 Tax=Sediminibacter sp. Hel_I_10 TaxID=1392490 RepID=UPI00047C2DAF|nr:glycosyltransferase family 4 protein [Sediminibacter sp. Hel_I_10]
MKRILYVGNDLVRENVNTSVMRTLGPALEAEGYTVFYTSPRTNKFFRLLDMLFSILWFRRRVDVVFIDTYSTLNFYYALLVSQLARLLHLPYIPMLHGGNLVSRLRTNSSFSKCIFNHALVNVSPSAFLKTEFERHGYSNVICIPNVIDIGHYEHIAKSYDTPRLLWVRSFTAIYNPKQAILVLSQLQQRGYKGTLCMVGPDTDGSMEPLKRLAQELHLEVRFTGKLSKAQWISMSQEYNLFVNTTTVDNTPVSVIEAMALGFPIVSTDVGGMPYLINHGQQGILVQMGNVNAMTDGITQLLKSPETLEKMSANARALAENFDWSQVKELWFDVLERV